MFKDKIYNTDKKHIKVKTHNIEMLTTSKLHIIKKLHVYILILLRIVGKIHSGKRRNFQITFLIYYKTNKCKSFVFL